MNNDTYPTIARFARGQLGHVTRAQMRTAGLSASAIGRQVTAGRLLQVGGRTFRLASAAVDPFSFVMAACLEVGGVASHRTAAWMHGHAPRPVGSPGTELEFAL